jgi:hypothetical protein
MVQGLNNGGANEDRIITALALDPSRETRIVARMRGRSAGGGGPGSRSSEKR